MANATVVEAVPVVNAGGIRTPAPLLAPRPAKGPSIRRCPACGHRFEPPAPPVCDLCGFQIDGSAATGADVTPYAQAYSRGERGWWRMLEWIWFSSGERIRHAALLRASAASRRFAQTNLLLLTLAATAFQVGRVGWFNATANVSVPSGDGWVEVVGPTGWIQPRDGSARLWWNPPQAALSALLSLCTAILLSWLTLWLMRTLTEKAHRPQYRGEYRMTAALHYSTAWAMPVLVGAWIMALLPWSYIGDAAGWGWHPDDMTLLVAGGALAGLGVCLGWFWLVRAASAAPVRTRARLAAFYGAAAPAIVGAAVLAWMFGLSSIQRVLLPALGFQLD